MCVCVCVCVCVCATTHIVDVPAAMLTVNSLVSDVWFALCSMVKSECIV